MIKINLALKLDPPVIGDKARLTRDLELLQENNIPREHAGEIVIILQSFQEEKDGDIVCVKTSDGHNHLAIWGKHVFPLSQRQQSGSFEYICPLCGSAGQPMAVDFYCSNKDCKNYR